MTAYEITRILKAHGVRYYVKDGNIYADSMESGTAIFEKVENVTEWNRIKLRNWLGY